MQSFMIGFSASFGVMFFVIPVYMVKTAFRFVAD